MNFKPANTIEEAEQYISKYVDANGFGALGVSYNGIKIDAANEINKAFTDFYNRFDVDKFGGIIAPAGNTKLGKLAEQCAAGYIPSRNSFLINRKTLKDIKTAKAHFAEERKLVSDFLNYPEKFNKDKIPQIVRSILDGSKESGRSLVAENITDTINHELGHMLERKVTASQLWKISEKNMKNYATKVSGYATSSKGEYLAESFASFLKGEDVIDPNLKKLFESFEKR